MKMTQKVAYENDAKSCLWKWRKKRSSAKTNCISATMLEVIRYLFDAI